MITFRMEKLQFFIWVVVRVVVMFQKKKGFFFSKTTTTRTTTQKKYIGNPTVSLHLHYQVGAQLLLLRWLLIVAGTGVINIL